MSLYDIVSKKWIDHFFVDTKVVKVFRNEKDASAFNLGVYLENGKIELIDSSDTSTAEHWEKKRNAYTTTGKVILSA